MQVVLFDGTSADKLRRKMSMPASNRGRAVSVASAQLRPTHVKAVGEGLDVLRDGKSEHGIIYSICGAGGLISPSKYPDACISFSLTQDDKQRGLQQGDHVMFTVGRNKKSGRKYASKVSLQLRAKSDEKNANTCSPMKEKDFFSESSTRWVPRRRAATMSEAVPVVRRRAFSIGAPPLTTPRRRLSTSKDVNEMPAAYRQAIGPDGTKGFAKGRGKEHLEVRKQKISHDQGILSTLSENPHYALAN